MCLYLFKLEDVYMLKLEMKKIGKGGWLSRLYVLFEDVI